MQWCEPRYVGTRILRRMLLQETADRMLLQNGNGRVPSSSIFWKSFRSSSIFAGGVAKAITCMESRAMPSACS